MLRLEVPFVGHRFLISVRTLRRFSITLLSLSSTLLNAAEPQWSSLVLPADANRSQVTQQVEKVRTRLATLGADGRRKIERTDLEGARAALRSVRPEFVDILLAECRKDAAPETKEFTLLLPGREMAVIGEKQKPKGRSPFVFLVLTHVLGFGDVPPEKHRSIFSHWDHLPELVVLVSRVPWSREGDPFVTPVLMRKIDTEIGWRDTARIWIKYLFDLDSANAWKAFEYLVVDAEIQIRLLAYEELAQHPAAKLNIDIAVKNAWRSYVRNPGGLKYPTVYAPIAARHGITDAVVALARYIKDPKMKNAVERRGADLLELLHPSFSDARQAADFVVANARRLVFDPTHRKYDVPRSSSRK